MAIDVLAELKKRKIINSERLALLMAGITGYDTIIDFKKTADYESIEDFKKIHGNKPYPSEYENYLIAEARVDYYYREIIDESRRSNLKVFKICVGDNNNIDFLVKDILCWVEKELRYNPIPEYDNTLKDGTDTNQDDVIKLYGHRSEGLEMLQEVICQFWKDKDTAPKSEDIVKYLKDNFACSGNLAEHVDKLLRPAKFQKGGRPKSR